MRYLREEAMCAPDFRRHTRRGQTAECAFHLDQAFQRMSPQSRPTAPVRRQGTPPQYSEPLIDAIEGENARAANFYTVSLNSSQAIKLPAIHKLWILRHID